MILVTGATGTVGRELVRLLLENGAAVRAMTRHPGRARDLFGDTVEIVRADFEEPASIDVAAAGIDAAFLLTAYGEAIDRHDRAMVRAAQAAGVRKIVKLSVSGAGAARPLTSASSHAAGEAAVTGSGLAWTLLRPAGFASNALGWLPAIRVNAAIEVATGDGRHAVVDPRDVAEVAARALKSAKHDGQAYTLTGPEAISAPVQIDTLSRALGRSIPVTHVTPETAIGKMRGSGVPAEVCDAVLEGLRFVRDGGAAEVSGDVRRVLGRDPRSFEHWVRDHLPAFTAAA